MFWKLLLPFYLSCPLCLMYASLTAAYMLVFSHLVLSYTNYFSFFFFIIVMFNFAITTLNPVAVFVFDKTISSIAWSSEKTILYLDTLMHWYIHTSSLLIVLILLTSPKHSWTVLSYTSGQESLPHFSHDAIIYWNIFLFLESFLQYKGGTVNISL